MTEIEKVARAFVLHNAEKRYQKARRNRYLKAGCTHQANEAHAAFLKASAKAQGYLKRLENML